MKDMVTQLGNDFALESSIPEFSRRASDLLNSYLGTPVKWYSGRVIEDKENS
jgi:hypothetical protein